jgi:beta-aspartyl-peptidase (threonine type)
MDPQREAACLEALRAILDQGRTDLAEGKSAVDVVESIAILLEDEPLFNAGKGAVFARNGTHELEASIMVGSTLECGAVSNLSTVQNPIRLARLVMEQTPHILLSGEGAESYADAMGVNRVDNTWFDTDHRRTELQRFLDRDPVQQEGSTIGVVARDTKGNLAAATSTGGMTGKMPGRIGDTPMIGSGTYADGSCAVSCTGQGEEFIRHVIAHEVASQVRLGHLSVLEATMRVVHEQLPPGAGGVIAVGVDGVPVAVFNSLGMYRGLADSSGHFETAIWED